MVVTMNILKISFAICIDIMLHYLSMCMFCVATICAISPAWVAYLRRICFSCTRCTERIRLYCAIMRYINWHLTLTKEWKRKCSVFNFFCAPPCGISFTGKPRDVEMSYLKLFIEQVVHGERLRRLSLISLWTHKQTAECASFADDNNSKYRFNLRLVNCSRRIKESNGCTQSGNGKRPLPFATA